MATKTEQLLSSVKFNKLTKTQYDAALLAGQISPTEFYYVEENETPVTIALSGGATSTPVVLSNFENVVLPVTALDSEKLSVKLSRPNLLDNAYFLNAVPTIPRNFPNGDRGTFIIGRWFYSYDGNETIATINSTNGIVTRQNADDYVVLKQQVDSSARILLNTNNYKISMSGNIFNSTAEYNPTTGVFKLKIFSNESVKWVKLELGDYATEFIPKSYSEEYNTCLKYFELIGNATTPHLVDFGYTPINRKVFFNTFNFSPKVRYPDISFSDVSQYRLLYYDSNAYATNASAVTAISANQIISSSSAIMVTAATPPSSTCFCKLQRQDSATSAWITINADSTTLT